MDRDKNQKTVNSKDSDDLGGNVKNRSEDRALKRKDRWNYRVKKIEALTAKAYAVAAKRKWLVFMIGSGIVAFLLISSGGLGGLGGILDKVKSFF
tara:strand:+ start:28 stop:312 length:285 start_codon:yes stop_codon:yes gene_type:complete